MKCRGDERTMYKYYKKQMKNEEIKAPLVDR